MTTISVKLSQAVHDTSKILREQNGIAGLSEIVDVFFKFSHLFTSTHPEYSSGSYVGANLRLNYDDGAFSNFLGVVDNTPGQNSGTGSATSLEQNVPSAYKLTYGGNIKIKYTEGTNGTNFESAGGTLTAAAIQTQLPSYSSAYNSILGNITIVMQGSININPAGDFAGSLSSFTQRSEKFISTGTMAGDLTVSGNAVAIGLNLASTAFAGTLHNVTQQYHDGSYWKINDAAIKVVGTSVLDESIFSNPANFPNNDLINISLPATVSTQWHISSGAGDDTVTLLGGGAALSVNAGSGNDRIFLKDHQHAVDGGSGTDTVVFSGLRTNFNATKIGATVTVNAVGAPTKIDQLKNVERLAFDDQSIALDIDGIAGQAYRIYQAAFNRAPDSAGAGYWIRAMDDGLTLSNVAQQFVTSNEFRQLFGQSPSNKEIISKFYANVLHREGEASGIDYWTKVLDTQAATVADVLVGFSESPENQIALATIIGNGFSYTPFG